MRVLPPGGTLRIVYGISTILWGVETEIAALYGRSFTLLNLLFGRYKVKPLSVRSLFRHLCLIHYLYGYDALLEPGIDGSYVTERTVVVRYFRRNCLWYRDRYDL